MILSRIFPFGRRAMPTALVVEPTRVDRAFVGSTLGAARFRVRVARTFDDAKFLLDSDPPAVLVSNLRLEAYNGIHLAMRGKRANPRLAVIIMTAYPDSVLHQEVERLGGTYIETPVGPDDLLAAICRTIVRERDKDPAPVRSPFNRRFADRRRRALDATASVERRAANRRRGLSWDQVIANLSA